MNYYICDKDDFTDIDVVCIGHFNVLHPGHFRFLNFASSLGKALCIILKGDDEFSSKTKHHYFPENDRAVALSNIVGVKKIVIKKDKSYEECLDLIKPKFLVLGHEFERKQTGDIGAVIEKAKTSGIEVVFHSGDRNVNIASSFWKTETISPQKAAFIDFMRICRRRKVDLESIKTSINKFSSLQTLVVGDLIVDEFINTQPLGLSSEAPVVVVKEIEKKQYIGGAGVVAAHVASLGANSYFLSVSGDDEARKIALDKLKNYGVKADILIDATRPTTYKIRYIAGNQKLFRVSQLMDHDLEHELEDQIIEKIRALAPTLDNIIVSDFVYGFITKKILFELNRVAKQFDIKLFGDLQCSSQVGNVLKFKNFEMIFPTEKEARIAIENKDDGLEFVANSVFKRCTCNKLIIKLGGDGLIVYEKKNDPFIEREHFPALSTNPVDVSGAGDSLLATIATAISSGMSLMDAAALGSIVASCCVETLGNFPIQRDVLNSKIDMLNKDF